MASIINKLLGREDESESGSQSHQSYEKSETSTSATSGDTKQVQRQNSGGGQNSSTRTVQHEGVNIKSTISSDNSSSVSLASQQKLTDLVTRLGSTHTQVDEYAKKQTAKINEDVQREIDQVVTRTRQQQEELLKKANEHTTQIDTEYRARLQKMVEEVDAVKAKRIADIETELNNQQAGILQMARAEIDKLNQKAANLKIDVLQQAQAKATADASNITAQAANLGQASTLHQSTGTTTIKTEVSASGTTKEAGDCSTGTACKTGGDCSTSGSHGSSETKTVETSRNQSHQSKH